jgi:phosphoglycolate phosphatase
VSRAILFDLDGTLVDSRADLAHAVNAALVAVDLPRRSIAEITGFIGEGSRRLVEKAIAPHPERFAEAHAAWEKAYAATLLERTRLYPGMRELLDRLHGPVPFKGRGKGEGTPPLLAVHTNKPGKYARPILEGLGVGARFARVLGAGDGAANKPSPEGVRLLLTELGAELGAATYVGDSAIDLQTAAAAGVDFIGVAWGYGGEAQLRAAGASRIARDAGELERWLMHLV